MKHIWKQIRKHLVHKNTVFFSWVISYLIILCLPFCISSILMHLLIQSVRQETQETYRNELINTQILLDEKLSEMNRLALELSLNKEIDRLVSLSSLSAQEHFSFYTLQQRFQEYSISNHFISSIALYLPDLQTCITNKSCYRKTCLPKLSLQNPFKIHIIFCLTAEYCICFLFPLFPAPQITLISPLPWNILFLTACHSAYLTTGC